MITSKIITRGLRGGGDALAKHAHFLQQGKGELATLQPTTPTLCRLTSKHFVISPPKSNQKCNLMSNLLNTTFWLHVLQLTINNLAVKVINFVSRPT